MIASQDFSIHAVFLPASVSPSDPLGQRSYLGIKFYGGLMVDSGSELSLIELRDHITQQVETTLRRALQKPDETVVSPVTA